MHKPSRTVVLLSLLCLLALGPLLSGCSAVNTAKQVANAAKELATQAPGIAKEAATKVAEASPEEEPTEAVAEEPTEEPSSEPAEETASELENTFDNLVRLAPLHMSSSFVYKENGEVQNSLSYEADVDANGNQHLILSSNNEPVEIYLVDGKMYMKSEGDQYIGLGDVEDDTGFSFLAVYGGAYLLAFNDLQEAKLVGHEAVGPWQADKYTINMDLGSFGLGGLAAGAEGYQWEYTGTAWVEPNAKALVKAVVDWSGKNADSTVTESWHSEFLASAATITEIKAPENVLSMGG